MKQRKLKPTRGGFWKLTASLVTALALTGCLKDGDDGETGTQGPAGAPGPLVKLETPSSMTVTISDADVASDGKLTVVFSIEDGDGYGYAGLEASDFRMTVAQLQEAASGESTKWQNYVNQTESAPDPADGIGSGTEDQIQATYERGSTGSFTNNGDGTYSYTFDTALNSVTTPVAVSYDATLTHRVAIQFGGGLPATNTIYDWQPSTGATSGLTSREIVTQEVCNSCHGKLAVHGTGRIATAYCVTCHNPGTTDANSGNTVDFKVMIHKIHRGSGLPSVQSGGSYQIWGFRNSEHDYSEVAFPQDIRNCTTCHAESNATTPQASNWRTAPTMEACGSCHDDVNFADGTNHPAGAYADNTECAGCHGEGAVLAPVDQAHVGVMDNKALVKTKFTVTPISATIDQTSGDIDVRVRIELEGNPVDRLRLAGDPDADTTEGAKLGKYKYGPDNGALAVNWDDGNGFQVAHQEVDLNDCVPDADGSGLYTCSMSGVLSGITDSDIVTVTTVDSLLCFNERETDPDLLVSRCDATGSSVRVVQVPVTPIVVSFYGDGTAVADGDGYAKIGASIDACESCHTDRIFHHGATELIQCKTCHNAERASSRGRPADLKHHVHRLHSTLDRDELDVDEVVDHFPNNVDNCNACHADGQFDLPLQQNSRAAYAARGAEVYISATAVVCASCHIATPLGYIDPLFAGDGYVDPTSGNSPVPVSQQPVVDHMLQNGAVFGASTYAEANKPESCAVCHAVGQQFGVDTVHDLK